MALGSGGTISGKTGADVSLTNASDVVLRNVVIQANAGDGVAAADVAGLVLDNVLVNGHAARHGLHGTRVSGLAIQHSEIGPNATAAAAGIWNVRFDDLLGTAVVASSRIHQSQETVFGLLDTAGMLDLTIANTSITDAGTGMAAGNGLRLLASGSASVTAALQNEASRGRLPAGSACPGPPPPRDRSASR